MGLLNRIRNIRKDYEADGILSWIICLSALTANAIVVGIDCSFGEILGSIMMDFNSTESNVAWIGSVHSSTQYFSASLSSLLAKKYGFGPIIVAGILISSTFFALSATAYNVSKLTIYYGFLGGLGIGLIYSAGHIICSFHFVKRRSMATGIAICGSGIGVVLVSYGANIIDKWCGWQGYVVFCALICPLCGFLACLAILLPEKYEKEARPLDKNDYEIMPENGAIERYEIIRNTLKLEKFVSLNRYKLDLSNIILKEKRASRSYHSNKSNLTFCSSETNRIHSKVVNSFTNMLSLEQLKDIRLLIFCSVTCLYTLGYFVPIDFLPDCMAKEHGISHLQAGNIIPIYGISSICGRLIGGILTSCMEKSAILLVSICMLLLGVACSGMALSTYYWQFAVCVSMYGIFLGMFGVLRTISLVEMFGVDSLKECYGVIMLFSGVSTLFGPPMAGWLKVYWGTYYYAFFVTAGIFATGGIVALILVLRNRKEDRNEQISY